MKLSDFRKIMEKDVFKTAEARVAAFRDNPKLVNLQLHQWEAKGELIRLKRGLYAFAGVKPTIAMIADSLYSPCYFSLEAVLAMNGIIPEAVFAYTLVTPKPTRRFETPFGTFIFHTIKKEAFTGFDSGTLLAEKEKALADYFYLNRFRMKPAKDYWKESRLNGGELDFKKVFRYAKLFKSKKLDLLLTDFQRYAKSHQTHR